MLVAIIKIQSGLLPVSLETIDEDRVGEADDGVDARVEQIMPRVTMTTAKT